MSDLRAVAKAMKKVRALATPCDRSALPIGGYSKMAELANAALALVDALDAAGLQGAITRPPELQRRLFDECETAGWDPAKANTFGEECTHLHEEVTEAFREWRLHKDCAIRVVDGRPTGVPIEFADILIGLFYNAELHGFDLMAAVELKHEYNLTRDYCAEGRQLHPSGRAAGSVP